MLYGFNIMVASSLFMNCHSSANLKFSKPIRHNRFDHHLTSLNFFLWKKLKKNLLMLIYSLQQYNVFILAK